MSPLNYVNLLVKLYISSVSLTSVVTSLNTSKCAIPLLP